MNVFLVGFVIFIFCLLLIELTAAAIRMIQHPDRAEVRKRLRRSLAVESDGDPLDITRKTTLSDVPFLNRLLPFLPGVDRLDLLMRQANVKYTLGFFVLLSLALGFLSYLLLFVVTKNMMLALLLGVAAASLPLMTLRSKKKKRMARFEKQLPDALGLIARALRAGHAFTSGLKLASEEFTDPIGPEFEETLDEINFGVSVPEALKNLAYRADCPDVKFFVVAVILQRETGGNLAEIIEGLAHLIRERFKFRGKVRVLSAEGRLSAAVLLAIPVLMFAFLFITQRQFLDPLFFDPVGKILIWVAVFMMIFGYFLIRRIIKVEV